MFNAQIGLRVWCTVYMPTLISPIDLPPRWICRSEHAGCVSHNGVPLLTEPGSEGRVYISFPIPATNVKFMKNSQLIIDMLYDAKCICVCILWFCAQCSCWFLSLANRTRTRSGLLACCCSPSILRTVALDVFCFPHHPAWTLETVVREKSQISSFWTPQTSFSGHSDQATVTEIASKF